MNKRICIQKLYACCMFCDVCLSDIKYNRSCKSNIMQYQINIVCIFRLFINKNNVNDIVAELIITSRFSPFGASIKINKNNTTFHAKTFAALAATIAAAAWSWVEKMLQEAHLTWAPQATSVSIKTAVWMVMCNDPDTLAPASTPLNSSLQFISPGISISASSISFLPQSAKLISATFESKPSILI